MKRKISLLITILIFPISLVWAQSVNRTQLESPFGPPASADTWELFQIPVTPEAFGTDAATLQSVLANITSFRIRTEMHTGYDVGGVDVVVVGTLHSSNFISSTEGWSSGGDGTLEWIPTGGAVLNQGYIQISDWATGDWHWVIAPPSWSGDWSSLFGGEILFFYKTDQPSYAAIVVITSEIIYRLVLDPSSNIVPENGFIPIDLEVVPTPTSDLTVNLTSSDNSCITVPSSVIVPAGNSSVSFDATAVIGTTDSCTSVIESTASGYETSRVTLTVEDQTGIDNPANNDKITIFPNPCQNTFRISLGDNTNIDRLVMYDLYGKVILDSQEQSVINKDIDVSDQPTGIYFVKVFAGRDLLVSKVVIE